MKNLIGFLGMLFISFVCCFLGYAFNDYNTMIIILLVFILVLLLSKEEN